MTWRLAAAFIPPGPSGATGPDAVGRNPLLGPAARPAAGSHPTKTGPLSRQDGHRPPSTAECGPRAMPIQAGRRLADFVDAA